LLVRFPTRAALKLHPHLNLGVVEPEKEEISDSPRLNNCSLYLDHYHNHRCHQGLGNELIVPLERPPDVSTKIEAIE
jgi:hypothetical protein